jgi:hypothetical protein
MTTQSRHHPLDPASLWSLNQPSLDDAETLFRAWFEFSGRAQEEATKFLTNRWTKDSVALAQFGQCRTPVDAVKVQMAYLTGAYEDYLSEGQKIFALFSDVASETLPGMSAGQGSERPKHSGHRGASH